LAVTTALGTPSTSARGKQMEREASHEGVQKKNVGLLGASDWVGGGKPTDPEKDVDRCPGESLCVKRMGVVERSPLGGEKGIHAGRRVKFNRNFKHKKRTALARGESGKSEGSKGGT